MENNTLSLDSLDLILTDEDEDNDDDETSQNNNNNNNNNDNDFSIDHFSKLIYEFIRESSSFADLSDQRASNEQQCQLVHKKVWTMTEQTKFGNLRDPTVPFFNIINFSYKYKTMEFSNEHYNNFVAFHNKIDELVSGSYMNNYFKQIVSQQKLMYALFANPLNGLQWYQVLNSVVKVIAQDKQKLKKYARSVLQELAIYAGKMYLETDYEEKQKQKKCEKLMRLIMEYDAIDYLVSLFQPEITDLIDCKLLTYIFNERNLERIPWQHMVKLLNQIPFKSLNKLSSSSDVSQYVLEPLKNALDAIVNDQNQNLGLSSHISKLIVLIVNYFPELHMDGLLALTRTKWPSMMVSHTVLAMLPWKKMSEEVRAQSLNQIYNVYSKSVSNFSENEFQTHLNDYVNKFLIPYRAIVKQIYVLDNTLASANMNLTYPITQTLRKLAEVSLNEDEASMAGQQIVTILFALAFRSGTTIPGFLTELANLRAEACDQIATLCKTMPIAFYYLLTNISKYLSFLLQTQPYVLEQIFILIDKCSNGCNQVHDLVYEQLEKFLSGNVLNSHGLQKASEGSARIARLFIEKFQWKNLDQTSSLKIVQTILKSATLNNESYKWAASLFSSSVGDSLTFVKDVKQAEDFLKSCINVDNDLYIGLSLQMSLGICFKKLELTKDYNSQYDIWLQFAKESNITSKLERVAKFAFLPTILKKYIMCLSVFLTSDIQEYLRPATLALSTYLKQNFQVQDIEALIKASSSAKEIETWALILIEGIFSEPNLDVILDHLIRDHFASNLDMEPITNAITNKATDAISLNIGKLIAGNKFWSAYAFIKALEIQLPPVREVYDQLTHQVASIELSTDIECGMWIAVDCAVKAAQRNRHLISLLFWQHFFILYFQLREKYGSHIFPQYLKERYTTQLNNQLRCLPPEHTAANAFRLLCSWDKNKCNSGVIIDKILLPLIIADTFIAPVSQEPRQGKLPTQPLDNVVRQNPSYSNPSLGALNRQPMNLNHNPIPQNMTWSSQSISSPYRSQTPAFSQRQLPQNNSLQPSAQQLHYAQRGPAPSNPTMQPYIPPKQNPLQQGGTDMLQPLSQSSIAPVSTQSVHNQTSEKIASSSQNVFPSEILSQSETTSQPSTSQTEEAQLIEVSNDMPQIYNEPTMVNLLDDSIQLSATINENDTADKKEELEVDLIPPPQKLLSNLLQRDKEAFNIISNGVKHLLSCSSQSNGLLLQFSEEIASENHDGNRRALAICEKMKKLFRDYFDLVQKMSKLNKDYLAYVKAIYINVPTTTTLVLRSHRNSPINTTVPINTIKLVEPDIIQKLTDNRKEHYEVQKKLHGVTNSIATVYTILHFAIAEIEKNTSLQYLAQDIVLDSLPILLDMIIARTLLQIWVFFSKEIGKIGSTIVSKIPQVQGKILDALLKAPAAPVVSYVTPNTPTTIPSAQRSNTVEQLSNSLSRLLNPIVQSIQSRPPIGQQNLQHVPSGSASSTHFRAPIQQPQPPQQNRVNNAPVQISMHHYPRGATPVNEPSYQRQYEFSQYQIALNNSIDRTILFNAFNPNVLLQNENFVDFIQLMIILTESKTQLSTNELSSLCNRFNMEVLFKKIEAYPEGSRFKERNETKLLLTALRNSLCRKDLYESIGCALLRNCALVAFAAETDLFIKMLLTLCDSGKCVTNDWHEYLLDENNIGKVSTEQAITWVNTIIQFPSLSPQAAQSSLRLVSSIISRTSLSSFLNRCDPNSDIVNTIIQFFADVIVDKNKKTNNLNDETFAVLLDTIASLTSCCQAIVDRLWQLYCTSLRPFAFTYSAASQKALTNFMKQVNWKNAVFHIQNQTFLDELCDMLLIDPELVSAIIGQLNWDFILRENDQSPNICKLLKLYILMEFLDCSSAIPPYLHEFFTSLDQYTTPNPIWQRIRASDFRSIFSKYFLYNLLLSNKISRPPENTIAKIAFWISEIAVLLNDAKTAEVIALEIRSLMFLIIKGTNRHVWYLPMKCQANLLKHCLIPLAIKYATPNLIQYLLSTLHECENGIVPVLIQQNLIFGSEGKCPFDKSVVGHVPETDSAYAAHQTLVKKFKDIVIHFASSANEQLALSIINCILVLGLHLETEVTVLEYSVRSLLKLTTHAHPRQLAANTLQLPSHMVLYSDSFNTLMNKCIETYSALSLAVLIHKLLDITIQNDPNQIAESITNGYIYAMDFIIKFVPHSCREDFDIIYLYFIALEMIDSPYWDMRNMYVRERTEKFTENLDCLGHKYGSNWSYGGSRDSNLKQVKISPSTCLACRAMRVYLFEILQSKRLMHVPSSGQLLDRAQYFTRNGSYSNEHFEFLLKLRGKKEFNSFTAFFDRSPALLQQLEHDQFRELIGTIFPLVPYMQKV